MSNLEASLHIDRLGNEPQTRGLLKRELSTESLRLLLKNALIVDAKTSRVRRVRRRAQSHNAIGISRRLLRRKPAHIKEEEEMTRKMFREREFWAKQQLNCERRQARTATSSSPTSGDHQALPSPSITRLCCSPSKLLRVRKRDLIKEQIQSLKTDFLHGHGDMPSPKSEDWFKNESFTAPAPDLIVKVENQVAVPKSPLTAKQKPLALIERRAGSLGRKLTLLKPRSTRALIPATPSTVVGDEAGQVRDRLTLVCESGHISPLGSNTPSSQTTFTSALTPFTVPTDSSTSSRRYSFSPAPSDESNSGTTCGKARLVDVPDPIIESEETLLESTSAFEECQANQELFGNANLKVGPSSSRADSKRLSVQTSGLGPASSIGMHRIRTTDKSSDSQNSNQPHRLNHHVSPNLSPAGQQHPYSLLSVLYSHPLPESSSPTGLEKKSRSATWQSPVLASPCNGRNSLSRNSFEIGDSRVLRDKELKSWRLNTSQDSFQATRPFRKNHDRAQSVINSSTNTRKVIDLPRSNRSSKTKSSPDLRMDTKVDPSGLYETDVLIQQQGGFRCFGRAKFNERVRSKPWQTIKITKEYDRPGDWSARYLDTPGKPRLVETPYSNESFTLPTDEWRWVNEFKVDNKSKPVDQDGWEYYDLFSGQWKPNPRSLRTFVRRRRWLRTRFRPDSSTPQDLNFRNIDLAAQDDTYLLETDSLHWLKDERDAEADTSKVIGVIIQQVQSKQTVQLCRLNRRQSQSTTETIESCVPEPILRFGWFDNNLDCHNPFFSSEEVAIELSSRFFEDPTIIDDHSRVEFGLNSNLLDQQHQLSQSWINSVTKINLKRVRNVLIEFSEYQKIKLWRYWLGLDTYKDAENRPHPEDVWLVIERHLDSLLDLFVYSRSRFAFLYLISRVQPLTIIRSQDYKSKQTFSPSGNNMNSNLAPIVRPPSPFQKQNNEENNNLIDQIKKFELAYWNDSMNLLSDLNTGSMIDDRSDLKKMICKQMRIELKTLIKTNQKKQKTTIK